MNYGKSCLHVMLVSFIVLASQRIISQPIQNASADDAEQRILALENQVKELQKSRSVGQKSYDCLYELVYYTTGKRTKYLGTSATEMGAKHMAKENCLKACGKNRYATCNCKKIRCESSN